ncbi:hypothetical protein AB0J21_17535 [Streptomyces sp. NPDC049954]|uniref:hypothetical protein n=1 Tax=Streptomyces sp. NPDC049954 TaxID=3155779 RepID=UPI0034454F09
MAEKKWGERLLGPEAGAVLAFVLVLALRLLMGSDVYKAAGNALWLAGVGYVVTRGRWRSDAKRLGTTSERVRAADEYIRKAEVPGDPEERRVVAAVVARRREQLGGRRAWVALAFLIVLFTGVAVLGLVSGEPSLVAVMVIGAVGMALLVVFTRRRTGRRLGEMERRPGEVAGGGDAERRVPGRFNASGAPVAPRTPSPRTPGRPAR